MTETPQQQPPSETPPNQGTKACPYCGEDIKQSAIICRFCGMDLVSHNATRSRSPKAGTSKAPAREREAEQVLWEANPSHWAYLPVYLLGAILAPFVIGVFLLIWAILDRKHTVYTVSNRRVIEKRGIIGRNLSEVNLNDIRNVIVKYGVLDRLLGIGAVGVATAGQAGVEIKITGCKDPQSVRRLIVDAKDKLES